MVNFEYYKVFYYVATCKSLTQAAELLSITQPAVSWSMKQLEESLGVKLFVRTSKGVKLTKEGEVLFQYVKSGCEQFETGEQVLARRMNLEAGEIRIGASDMTLQYYLLPFLEKFHEKYPKIKVNVTNGPTPETLKELSDGRIDFCVVTSPFEEKAEYEIKKVREIEDCFVAGRHFGDLKDQVLNFEDLLKYPIISLEQNTSTRKYMDGLMAENGICLNPEFELATSDMIVQFAARNLGIGCVVKDFAREQLEEGKLFALRFDQIIPKRHMCLVTSNKLPVSHAAQRLIELM